MSSFDAAQRFRARTLATTVTIATDPELDAAVQDAAEAFNTATSQTRRSIADRTDPAEVEALQAAVDAAVAAREASGLTVHMASRGQHVYLDIVNDARANNLSVGHMQYEVARRSFDKITDGNGDDTGLGWDDLDANATGPEMDAILAAATALYRSADPAPFARRSTSSDES